MEKIVSYTTAKLAKEKGFNFLTQKAYINNKLFVNFESSEGNESEYYFDADDFYENWNSKDWVFNEEGGGCFGCKLDNKKWFEAYSAPTQNELQKWLRNNHNIHIVIRFQNINSPIWESEIQLLKGDCYFTGIDFTKENTYEEALEKALFEALKLIKNI